MRDLTYARLKPHPACTEAKWRDSNCGSDVKMPSDIVSSPTLKSTCPACIFEFTPFLGMHDFTNDKSLVEYRAR